MFYLIKIQGSHNMTHSHDQRDILFYSDIGIEIAKKTALVIGTSMMNVCARR